MHGHTYIKFYYESVHKLAITCVIDAVFLTFRLIFLLTLSVLNMAYFA